MLISFIDVEGKEVIINPDYVVAVTKGRVGGNECTYVFMSYGSILEFSLPGKPSDFLARVAQEKETKPC